MGAFLVVTEYEYDKNLCLTYRASLTCGAPIRKQHTLTAIGLEFTMQKKHTVLEVGNEY